MYSTSDSVGYQNIQFPLLHACMFLYLFYLFYLFSKTSTYIFYMTTPSDQPSLLLHPPHLICEDNTPQIKQKQNKAAHQRYLAFHLLLPFLIEPSCRCHRGGHTTRHSRHVWLGTYLPRNNPCGIIPVDCLVPRHLCCCILYIYESI